MESAPLGQHPQQAADQRCVPCGLMPHLYPRRLVAPPPDWPCLPAWRAARLGRSSCDGVLLDAVVNGVLQGICHWKRNKSSEAGHFLISSSRRNEMEEDRHYGL